MQVAAKTVELGTAEAALVTLQGRVGELTTQLAASQMVAEQAHGYTASVWAAEGAELNKQLESVGAELDEVRVTVRQLQGQVCGEQREMIGKNIASPWFP